MTYKRLSISLFFIGLLLTIGGFIFDNIINYPILKKLIYPKYYYIERGVNILDGENELFQKQEPEVFNYLFNECKEISPKENLEKINSYEIIGLRKCGRGFYADYGRNYFKICPLTRINNQNYIIEKTLCENDVVMQKAKEQVDSSILFRKPLIFFCGIFISILAFIISFKYSKNN